MLKLLHPRLLIELNRGHRTLDRCHKLVWEVLGIQAGILNGLGHNLLRALSEGSEGGAAEEGELEDRAGRLLRKEHCHILEEDTTKPGKEVEELPEGDVLGRAPKPVLTFFQGSTLSLDPGKDLRDELSRRF